MVSHEKEKYYVKTINNNVESFERKTVRKKILRIGYSICHELDEYDENIGFKIALKRCFNKPLSIYESTQSGEFRKDLVQSILSIKFNYIKEHPNNFFKTKK